MASKISFFNKTVFSKTLKRFFPWCICYALILLVTVPISTLIDYNNYYYEITFTQRLSSALWDAQNTSPFIIVYIFIAAILSAMLIYSYLYKDNAVSMFHSLPAKRSTLLFTSFLAGLVLLITPLILAQGSAIVIALCFGLGELALLHGKLFLGYLAVTFIFFSIASFCSLMAGHIVTVPILYTIVNVFAYGIALVLDVLSNYFLFGAARVNMNFLEYLSPIGYLYNDFTENISNAAFLTSAGDVKLNVLALVIYIAAAFVLLLLSLLLYKKRALECAGDILAFKKTAWFFQIVFAVATGIIASAILYEFNESNVTAPAFTIVSFVVGSFFGFFGGRMLIRKRFFIFRETIGTFLIFAACSATIMLFVDADVIGFERKIPDNKEVKEVSIHYSESFDDEDFVKKAISLHKQIVQNKKSIEKRLNDPEYDIQWVSFYYTLENGRTMERAYRIPFKPEAINDITSMIYKYFELMNDPIAVESHYLCRDFKTEDLMRMDFVDNSTEERTELPLDDAIQIVEALQKDIEEGNILNELYYNENPISGNSPFLAQNHRQSMQILELYIYDDYDEVYEIYGEDSKAMVAHTTDYELAISSSNRYIYLKDTMVHTLKVLDTLGLVTKEKPLTYPPEEDVYYD